MEKAAPSFIDLIDTTTILSLLGVVAILAAAYTLSLLTLPRKSTTPQIRTLFIWHTFTLLIHLIFEGSFLYNIFLSSTRRAPLSSTLPSHLISPHPPNFLSDPSHVYGNGYASNWASDLWMVYAQADKRWAGVDLTVVSLELLTVLGGVPGAAWCLWCLVRGRRDRGFWMVVLGTGELYGGFMTFCPEWLTGNQHLDTSNFMFKWVFIVFFNMLWVVFPLYSLWWSYGDLVYGAGGEGKVVVNKSGKKGKGKRE